jgi:MraZ protein
VGKGGEYMFIGEYQHNLDAKGRLAVPAKFRARLKKGAVVTRGLDTCLFLYTQREWKTLAEKLITMPLSQSKSRAFARLMLAGAHEADIDSQGRINVPDHLILYAKLQKKTIVAGLYNRIEIWKETEWKKYKAQAEKDSEKIAESLGELGI